MNKCEWRDGCFWNCKGHTSEWEARRFLTEHNYGFCPFCGADVRKPVEIKVGMFGRFTYDSGDFLWGILGEIVDRGSQFERYWPIGLNRRNRIPYVRFTPGLPTRFNEDGTPKRETDDK